MKIFKIFVIISFALVTIDAAANDLEFGWNIGNVRLFYVADSTFPEIDAELLHFNWMYDKLSFGFSAVEFYNIDSETVDFSLLPLNVSFVPLRFGNIFFFSVYAQAGLGLIQYNGNGQLNWKFNGAIGTKLFIFPKLALNYSPYFSLFTEYNTRNKLKIGFGMDLSFLFYVAAMAFKDDVERERKGAFY